MNELITITKATINNEEVNAVNARDLWKTLEIETKFNTWMPRRIEEYEFEEGRDFVTNLGKSHGRPSKEYIISLDMAKELAMVENNEQGRRIRRYFIEVEKNARKFSEAVAAQVSAMIPVIREKRAAPLSARLRPPLSAAREARGTQRTRTPKEPVPARILHQREGKVDHRAHRARRTARPLRRNRTPADRERDLALMP